MGPTFALALASMGSEQHRLLVLLHVIHRTPISAVA